MSRPRKKKKKPGDAVALFPFLAVLICTMGSLIVLLVVLVQQARQQAEELAAKEVVETQESQVELREQEKVLNDQLDQLTTERGETLDQLDRRRLELGHLEEHISRLEEQWKQLVEQAKQLRDMADKDGSALEFANTQLELIADEIADRHETLSKLREQIAGRSKSYAIIPYAGASGTVRRPIYLECVGDSILIQPEGVTVKLADLSGPAGVGPGNPLDAALRTVREHLTAAATGEPYPLIVVRPGGERAYAAARAAMTTWDDEFGYELVSADMKLKYPKPDSLLAVKVRESIQRARSRQELLAAAMPGGFSRSAARFVVKRRGGLQRVGGRTVSASHESSGSDATDANRPSDEAGPTGESTRRSGPTGANNGGAAPIASRKGSGWGVPGANGDTQGFTRPVRVAVLNGRLLILPQRGQFFSPISTAYDGPLKNEDVMKFVRQLWRHMEGWGIAAQGGYWIPVLSVEVGPGAAAEFDRFQAFLQSSGIQIQRKAP